MSDISDLRVTSARWRLHPLLFGALTIAIADGLAAAFAAYSQRHTTELLAFAVWTIPLAIFTTWFARRKRFASRALLLRLTTTTAVGLLSGIAYTAFTYFMSGGYVLAFDFPVLYCWAIASTVGVLAAMVMQQSFPVAWAAGGFALAMLALYGFVWANSRPQHQITITYPSEAAANLVYDSVLTTRVPGKAGHTFKWAVSAYARGFDQCHAVATLVLRNGEDAIPLRAALEKNKHVLAVRDTVIDIDDGTIRLPSAVGCPSQKK